MALLSVMDWLVMQWSVSIVGGVLREMRWSGEVDGLAQLSLLEVKVEVLL